MRENITVEARIRADGRRVWQSLTSPEHIVRWNRASDEWVCPRASNDLREGGRFNYRMEARDGSAGFDFEGTFNRVVPGVRLDYTLGDGRKVTTTLTPDKDGTTVTVTFQAEDVFTAAQQREGWQAILDNMKKYTESLK